MIKSMGHMKNIILSLIIVLTMASCNQHGQTWKKLDIAESMMNSEPDSALAILEGIADSSIKGKEIKARYALLKSMALDKNYIDTTDFDILQPAIDYYLTHGNADEKLRTLYYQGRIYQNLNEKDSAMHSFMRGRELCQQSSDTMTMANLMVAQASIFYSMYKIDDFIQNNIEAANLYKAINRTDYEILSVANVLDGSIINCDRHLADSIMLIAQERVKQHTEFSSVIAPYVLSYAVRFGSKEEVFDVLNYYTLLDTLDIVTKIDIAWAYCKTGDSYNAKKYMDLLGTDSNAMTSLKYMAILPDVLEQNGDLAGALTAYRNFTVVIDSIHQNIFSQDLLFAKERYEMEKSNLLKIQEKEMLTAISLCIAFVLLLIVGCIYYRYRLSKAQSLLDAQEKNRLQLEQEHLKRENENLDLKNRHAEQEKQYLQQTKEELELQNRNVILEKQKAELECERQSLAAENLRLKIEQLEKESDTLKEILEKQKDLAKPIEDTIKIRVEMLNGLLASQITDNDTYAKPYEIWRDKIVQDKDEFMNSTRLAFKASHPRFIEYLEQHRLTIPEINYVCLYAIGLRGKEVGDYIQLKRHYHISSDIRKKLDIDEHQTNIGIYVRILMKEL